MDTTQSTGKLRILAVDDNKDAANVLALTLRVLGNDVKTAYDGLSAIEVAESFRPHLMLLDIGMPKLNGYDTARRIRELPWGSDTVLVALTGWGQDEDRLKAEQAGFDHHLVKPVEPATLQKLISSCQP